MGHDVTFERNGLFLRFFGTLTSADIRATESKVVGSPHWDRSRYSITDFTDVETMALEENDAMIFAHFDKASLLFSQCSKFALIATTPAVVELGKVYCEHARELNFNARIFRHLVEAREWIGISEP